MDGDNHRMYLSGDEDGSVLIICTHRDCMKPGRTTPFNPEGLWLQDVGNLPYQPSPNEVVFAWERHLDAAHGAR
ncbi:hypothetical protein NOK12_16650 [Nocardioides sp. OK12]|nr:hypothetical protein NOK12_16650 [Nocardioides sp. OK12]